MLMRRLLVSRRRAVAAMAGVWLAAGALIGVSAAVHETRTGAWMWRWREGRLSPIQPETGAAYIASTGRLDLSSHAAPSPALVLENGVPLGPGNAQHSDIRRLGRGRFSFWYDSVYLSASDNSDPRTNGRIYRIYYPAIGEWEARALYGLTAIALAASCLVTRTAVRSGVLAPHPERVLAWSRAYGASLLIALSVSSLAAVAALRAVPNPAAADSAWPWIFGLNLAAAWAVRRRFGSSLPASVGGVFLVAVGVGYGVLTALAPHRAQGCGTGVELPAWEMFCVAPDSASYYWPYTTKGGSEDIPLWRSSRNPLYPWFIRALTKGTGFDAESYMATHKDAGRPITDLADPLFRVVRAQIVLLLAASLVACFAMMRLLRSPLPAVVFLWLYDQLFFTAYELNLVLTEDLVQTCLLLLLAAFFWFLRSPRPWLLHAGAVLCGLLYLTRQAAAYGVVFLGVMMLWALALDWRSWWPRCASAVAVMVALFAVPDVYGLLEVGRLQRQQQSLQYQYRIAHSLQYARVQDVEVMPDEETRRWLVEAVQLRDVEHTKVDQTHASEYGRMVGYIAANLYSVAIRPGTAYSPQFLLRVANPLLARHRLEYLRFGVRFWQFGVSLPGLARTGVAGASPWLTYAALGALILWLRDRYAVAGATLVAGHWLHVLLASFFAAPLGRMVWATEFLVVLAGVLLAWGMAERLGTRLRVGR